MIVFIDAAGAVSPVPFQVSPTAASGPEHVLWSGHRFSAIWQTAPDGPRVLSSRTAFCD